MEDSRTSMADGNMSYNIERFTDLKEFDPEWNDEDIDEIVIMAPKSSRRLSTIVEDLSDVDNDFKVCEDMLYLVKVKLKNQAVTISDFELLEYSPGTKPKLCRKRNTSRLYALKTFVNCARTDSTERIILSMIGDIRAPFLPQVHWIVQDEDDLHIVMSYHPRDNILALLGRHGALRSDHSLFYASEIAQGIWTLHTAGIIHRDLSAENVLIDAEGHIILSGFECAASIEQLKGTQSKDSKPFPGGTKENQAPELLLGWTHDFAVDCWGFGILLHLLLSGVHPFKGDNLSVTREYLLKKVVRDPIAFHPLLEPVARDLISKCLERNPAVRLNIAASRKHDYFSAVKWEAVTAKRIQAPHFSNTTEVSSCYNAGYCNNTNKIPSLGLCKHKHCSEMKLPQSSSLTECTRTAQTIATPSRPQHFPELPKVSRMFSLLDDIPESAEGTPLNSEPPLMHSPLIYNNLLSENLSVEVAAEDRMTQFWEMLDSEQPSISISSSPDLTDTIPPATRKLRKARSSIHPEQRFSALSTSSLHNKLRKKSRPDARAPPLHLEQLHEGTQPVLELPTGVKKIGSGIGFTYTIPAAARSKASICTNATPTCHKMLQVKLPVISLGLRLANDLCKTITKTRTRRIPTTPEDQKLSETFPQDSRWSLVLPLGMSPDVLSSLALTTSDSNSSSPVSEDGPLTPDSVDFGECGGVMKGGFGEAVAHEVREGDPAPTLRLVSPPVEQCLDDF